MTESSFKCATADLLEFVRNAVIADEIALDASGNELMKRGGELLAEFGEVWPDGFDHTAIEEAEEIKILEEMRTHIAGITDLVERGRKTFTIVINWCDGDTDQGTFGDVVRAWDREHSEKICRANMENLDDCGDPFAGSVVELYEGNGYAAAKLETALLDLLDISKSVRVVLGNVLRATKLDPFYVDTLKQFDQAIVFADATIESANEQTD